MLSIAYVDFHLAEAKAQQKHRESRNYTPAREAAVQLVLVLIIAVEILQVRGSKSAQV